MNSLKPISLSRTTILNANLTIYKYYCAIVFCMHIKPMRILATALFPLRVTCSSIENKQILTYTEPKGPLLFLLLYIYIYNTDTASQLLLHNISPLEMCIVKSCLYSARDVVRSRSTNWFWRTKTALMPPRAISNQTKWKWFYRV